MAENVATTFELKEKHLEYLDEMAKKCNLPDRSEGTPLSDHIRNARSRPREASLFTEIRCANC